MSEAFEAQLTVKDRLNFPYLLANQILTFQKALLALEYSSQEVRETIEGLIHLIPESWKDDQFRKDLKEAQTEELIDLRPTFADTRMSEEACAKLGIQAYEKQTVFDYYKQFQACINLMDRRGLTAKRIYTEVMTGRAFEEEAEDIANSDETEL